MGRWRGRGEFNTNSREKKRKTWYLKACGDVEISRMTQVSGLGQWGLWGHSPGWSYRWSPTEELAAKRSTHPCGTEPVPSPGSPPTLLCPGIHWSSRFLLRGYFPFSCFQKKWTHALRLPVQPESTKKEHSEWLLKCIPSHLEHRLGGDPNTGPALTPSSRPHLLALGHKRPAASLYYEI